jgi:hypothetical protein
MTMGHVIVGFGSSLGYGRRSRFSRFGNFDVVML